MSNVKRMTFLVELADDMADLESTETHTVTCVLADQMRAEREARKLGGVNGKTDPVTLTALWAWAAMVRTKLTEAKFTDWSEHVVAIGDPEESDVDPTHQTAPSGSV